MTGFEPATPATRTQCATKLRYIPIFIRLAGSHQQFVQQYYTKKIKNQTNFYEKFQ